MMELTTRQAAEYAVGHAKQHDLKLIALSGHDGVGKSTLARAIYSELDSVGLVGIGIPLAGAVRTEAATFLGVQPSVMYVKPTPPWMRHLLRGIGEGRREVGPADYWIKLWDQFQSQLQRVGDMVVVDDVRYLNEARHFAEVGLVIALSRDGTDPHRPTDDEVPFTLVSIRETFLVRDLAQRMSEQWNPHWERVHLLNTVR